MKQRKNVFVSYLILMISSLSLLCVFHLNASEHHRISDVLKKISLQHLLLDKTLSERLLTICSNSAHENSDGWAGEWQNSLMRKSATQDAAQMKEARNCQKLYDLNALIAKISRDEQQDIKNVRHNLRVLNYLNPFLLLVVPIFFGVWRTGVYISLLHERKKLYIDLLTGAYNRRYLYRSAEEKKPRYLIMLDLDNFKEINDTYGHLVGDRVLVEFTNLLRQSLRKTEDIVRFGGDEFIIMLYDIQQEDADKIVNRLRFMSHQYIKVNENERILLPDFSAGIVEYSGSLEETIEKADTFVYQEKILNRSRR